MSRTYRPRLSKDRAVAQRVGEELERERQQDFSVSRQMSALGSQSPRRSTASPSSRPVNSELAWNSGSAQRHSSTPSTSSRGDRIQRGSRRLMTTATATAQDVADIKTRATSSTRSETRSPKRKRSRSSCSSDTGSASDVRTSCWACVSCSFLNAELAHKCRMCGTKNFQPRAKQHAGSSATKPSQEPRVQKDGTQEHCSRRRVEDFDTNAAPRAGARSINRPRSREAGSEDAYDARKAKSVTSGIAERINSSDRQRRLGTAMDRAAAAKAVEIDRRRSKSRGQTRAARTYRQVTDEHHANDFNLQTLPLSQKRYQERERVPGVIDVSSSPVAAGLITDLAPAESESEASPLRNGRRSSDPECRLAPSSPQSFDRSTSLSRGQTGIEGRGRRLPAIVTPLTHESDEQDSKRDDIGGSSSATPAARPPPSERPPREECEWPKVTLAASLDFSGQSVWEVSHVIVKQSNRHRPCAEENSDESETAVIICHSGGVSVWVLTDVEAICTHLTPALAGVAKEHVRGRFYVAAVAGGDGGMARSSATGIPGGVKNCIVAIGRHEADPGLPIIRVWQGPLLEAGGLRRRGAPDEKEFVLTTILKKKFSTFFPPVAARDALPHLCLCGFTAAIEPKDDGCGAWDGGVNPGEITCVMALGAKAVKIVCALGKSKSGDVRAKSLPTGSVDTEVVFTSLAAVPDNPFLVWASLPSSNALLLWDVQELRLLFTLPLTAWSICIPVVSLPSSLSAREHDVTVGSEPYRRVAGTDSPDSRPGQLRRSSPEPPRRRRDPALLCVLATETRVRNGSEHSSTAGLGCEFYGVCVDVDNDEGAHGSSISAVRLEGRDEASSSMSCNGSPGSCGNPQGSVRSTVEAYACSLSDGGGFVASVDREGNILARSVLRGDSGVLVAAKETLDGLGVASVDCDRGASVLAVTTTGGVGSVGANTVDLYTIGRK